MGNLCPEFEYCQYPKSDFCRYEKGYEDCLIYVNLKKMEKGLGIGAGDSGIIKLLNNIEDNQSLGIEWLKRNNKQYGRKNI